MWQIPIYPNVCRNRHCPTGYICDERANICYRPGEFLVWLEKAHLLKDFWRFAEYRYNEKKKHSFEYAEENKEKKFGIVELQRFLIPEEILLFLKMYSESPEFAAPQEYFELLKNKGIGSPKDFSATRTLEDLIPVFKPGTRTPMHELTKNLYQPLPSYVSQQVKENEDPVWVRLTQEQRPFLLSQLLEQKKLEEQKKSERSKHIGKKRGESYFVQGQKRQKT